MTDWPSVLAPWHVAPGKAGILLDFDGTLAPIVSDPGTSRPIAGAVEILASLAARYRLVAVVSGRPAAFLAAHLDVPAVERWGSYGLEVVAGEDIEVAPAAEPWRHAVEGVVDRARHAAPPGVVVEDKGISVTIHFRTAPHAAQWARAFVERERATTGLAVHEARMSVELRPPLAVDKGTVVADLLARSRIEAACYAGDDQGDLSAFRALGAARQALRIAVRSDETPPALEAAADAVVLGPSGVLELLRALIPPS